jgi:transcriptional regulator with XRE-family HTH domain
LSEIQHNGYWNKKNNRGVIGMNLRNVRKTKGICQWTLAKKSGCHQSRISLIERRLTVARKDEIEKLSEALNVSPLRIDWPK